MQVLGWGELGERVLGLVKLKVAAVVEELESSNSGRVFFSGDMCYVRAR
jgi:hypothetical protein